MLKSLLRVGLVVAVAWASTLHGQQVAQAAGGLQRRYGEGQVLHYRMTADNDGWKYTLLATDSVKRDGGGHFYEEIGWSNYFSSGQQTLTPASLGLRQTVSLDDPGSYMKVPDLAAVQPLLIGPITDTLTFYSDLLLAMRARLERVGQTAYVARSSPNSWADGQRVLVGQDAVDFSMKVESVDLEAHTTTLLIEHVPPPTLHVQQPALWMLEQKPAKPNNFVQVSNEDGAFVTETGHETFEVRLVVDSGDGHIVSAVMHNPVVAEARRCADRGLTQCGAGEPKTILREVGFKLVP